MEPPLVRPKSKYSAAGRRRNRDIALSKIPYSSWAMNDPNMMKCPRCRKYKHLRYFRCEDGKYPSRYCIGCERARDGEAEVRLIAKDKQERVKLQDNLHYLRMILKDRFDSARHHFPILAIMEFNITVAYLEDLYNAQNGRCAFSGRKMTLGLEGKNRRPEKDALSLDRIDSMKGYVEGNVRLVTYQINMAHATYSDADLLEMCRDVVEYQAKKEVERT